MPALEELELELELEELELDELELDELEFEELELESLPLLEFEELELLELAEEPVLVPLQPQMASINSAQPADWNEILPM